MPSPVASFSVRSLAQLLAVCAIGAALPALLCWQTNFPDNLVQREGPPPREFDPATEIQKLKRAKPNWVLIGNSMLNSRIDHGRLSKASGWRARKVSQGGTQSAIWFLFLKQVVVASGVRPALVTIFFRDTDPTWPDFRIKGINEPLIARLHGPEQPEWKLVFAQRSDAAGLVGKVEKALDALYPNNDLKVLARRQVQERAMRLTRIGTKMNSSGRRVELNERFSLGHVRHDLGGDGEAAGPGTGGENLMDPGFYEDGPMKFDPSPSASFLPHMISLAKENGIKLHFHRVKRRPGPDNLRPDYPAHATYMKEMRAWLDTQGVLMTDETADPSLTLEMYADGDHISEEDAVQQRYVKNFWDRVGPVIAPFKPSGK